MRTMRQRPNVGVLLPYVGGCYFATLLGGILRAARERGARVIAFQTTGMDLFWAAEPDTRPLGWDRIDGWIGINDRQGTAYYERIAAAGKPLVLVSARLPGHQGCAVLPDNGGVRLAVHHLIEHGHRRIAFAGALSHTDVRERYEGYLAGLREAGITPDPSLFFPMAGVVELDGREVGRKLVAARLPCTAIVACTDGSAIGIMDAVQGAGHRVPDELAVVGFDDIERAQYTNPPLSTVHMPFDVVARRGAEALLANLLDGTPMPAEIRVAGTLVPRRSCGCSRRQELRLLPASEASSSEAHDRERFTKALIALASGGRAVDATTDQELRPGAARIAA
ncbi:MAG: substrate-binding domain-containing protein, partial [Myxococcales bacterium]|nr:substrate-binding domain-containing protein [Myxococcales bacterium]